MNAETRIAITGATGFIGGRLAEVLWLRHGIRSRCLVRNLTRCAALSRMPVELLRTGDVGEGVEEALAGVDVLFHCAFDFRSRLDESLTLNLEGTRRLAAAARRAGVKRFVHLSTTAVYGFHPPAVCDEGVPPHEEDDAYVNTKIAIERMLAEEFADLPWTILRPSIVFGPGSGAWTVAVVQAIRAGLFPLVEGEPPALCNTSYVDNVVAAMLVAAGHPAAVRGIYNATDDHPVPWREFVAAHCRWCGVSIDDLPHTSRERLNASWTRMDRLKRGGVWPLYYDERLRWRLRHLLRRGVPPAAAGPVPVASGSAAPAKFRNKPARDMRTAPPGYLPVLLLERFRPLGMAALSAFAEYPSRRLAALGYKPVVDPAEALRRTATWLRVTNLLPPETAT